MKVADYVIGALADAGIDRIFVVYGAANGDLIDAFTRTDKTRYIAVMHEQGGGFAAEGYAKIKGVPGAAIATSGPGGQNLLTSMGNCFYDSVPCVFLTGQINSQFLRGDPSIRQVGFQETDIVGMAKPVTKYAKMVARAEDIRYEVEKALFLASEGRPGPVLLDIPMDVQKKEINSAQLKGFDPEVAGIANWKPVDVVQKIDQFLADLAVSSRPVLMIGGGVRSAGAVDDLLDLGEVLRIPVFPPGTLLISCRRITPATAAASGPMAVRVATLAFRIPICCWRSAHGFPVVSPAVISVALRAAQRNMSSMLTRPCCSGNCNKYRSM
jgi:acetolactate synthase-1/2/3 large subunit